jgi:hypothetical protein
MVRFVLGMADDGKRDAVSGGDEMQTLPTGTHKEHKSHLFRGPPRQVPEWNKVKAEVGLSD